MALIRGVSSAMMAELAKPFFYPVIMVELDWPSGIVRAHSNVGTLAFGGDWLGVGAFGTLELPDESSDFTATRGTVKLIGVPDEIFDHLEEPIRNRPGRVLFGCVTERAGNVLAGDPVEVFSGYMDAIQYKADASGKDVLHGVVLELGTGPSARAFASVTHSYEDQSRKYPTDTGGRLLIAVEAEAEKISWPET